MNLNPQYQHDGNQKSVLTLEQLLHQNHNNDHKHNGELKGDSVHKLLYSSRNLNPQYQYDGNQNSVLTLEQLLHQNHNNDHKHNGEQKVESVHKQLLYSNLNPQYQHDGNQKSVLTLEQLLHLNRNYDYHDHVIEEQKVDSAHEPLLQGSHYFDHQYQLNGEHEPGVNVYDYEPFPEPLKFNDHQMRQHSEQYPGVKPDLLVGDFNEHEPEPEPEPVTDEIGSYVDHLDVHLSQPVKLGVNKKWVEKKVLKKSEKNTKGTYSDDKPKVDDNGGWTRPMYRRE